ncbi:MAG: type II toxin-antitoxin system VapB family antitoxin [Propionibacteriales bacterium]|nr:type II toxin-antitoxin system VapB family antitoxin [Propionibacteriales bacterium]
MVTMNIKDPKVHELANELATLRGTTATAAVRTALELALATERARQSDRGATLAGLQQRAAGTQHAWLSDGDLYGEDGLPR